MRGRPRPWRPWPHCSRHTPCAGPAHGVCRLHFPHAEREEYSWNSHAAYRIPNRDEHFALAGPGDGPAASPVRGVDLQAYGNSRCAREEAAVVESLAAAIARDAHRRLQRVLSLSATVGRQRPGMGRFLPGNHHPRDLSLPRPTAMGLVPQRVSGPTGRGGPAGKGAAAAADLVGGLQHRRRAGDCGLLHRRLSARPATMADSYPGHGHRLGVASRGQGGDVQPAGHAAGARELSPPLLCEGRRRPALACAADLDGHARVSTAQPDDAVGRPALRPGNSQKRADLLRRGLEGHSDSQHLRARCGRAGS